MKNLMFIIIISVLLVVPAVLTAQPLPTDPTIGGGATGSGPIGGCAPIGEGLLMLIMLSGGYYMKKLFVRMRKLTE